MRVASKVMVKRTPRYQTSGPNFVTRCHARPASAEEREHSSFRGTFHDERTGLDHPGSLVVLDQRQLEPTSCPPIMQPKVLQLCR